jgi:hypothetical protein
MTGGERSSFVRQRPFLAAFLVALAVVWAVSVATWTVDQGGVLQLHPVAQGLQYLLAVIAATLAGLRLRLQPRERGQAVLGFFDRQLAIADDPGGHAFWIGTGIGALVLAVNVVILVLADLVVGGGTAGLATYLGWIGGGVAAGAILGMLSAFVAVVVAFLLRRGRQAR